MTDSISFSSRRSVSFSETVQKCEPQLLDKSSYARYLNCWSTYEEHKGFKQSVRELAGLLDTNPNLKTNRTQSTIFRGIERHTATEKVRIREKREISYSIVESLQGRSDRQMAKMLRSHSDGCLKEAYNRALEDEKESQDTVQFEAAKKAGIASLMTSPRAKPRHMSRRPLLRQF
ncbi:MAG: hypothetical protein SGBAC_010899 [Bacillariaceae sp.]